MARGTKTAAAGVAPASATDTPSAGHPGPSAAASPSGSAAAVMAALMAAPGATAAQLVQAAGITRAAAGRESAALEKAGQAARDGVRPRPPGRPGTSPRRHRGRTAGLPRPAVRSAIAVAGMATQDTGAPGAGDPDSEEKAVSATPASLADIAPGADEALSTAADARAGTPPRQPASHRRLTALQDPRLRTLRPSDRWAAVAGAVVTCAQRERSTGRAAPARRRQACECARAEMQSPPRLLRRAD